MVIILKEIRVIQKNVLDNMGILKEVQMAYFESIEKQHEVIGTQISYKMNTKH